MKRPKIVIVGGGSVLWVPRFVRDMMLTPALSEAEYVLLDIKPSAAKLAARFLSRLNKDLKTGVKLTPSTDQDSALKGADYVVITIAAGGLTSMAPDLKIPEEYGIYQTVGDTIGPGGWVRTVRNYGVFRGLANAFNKHCPNAVILNYSNPMTSLTDILSRICKGPVVGLCHGVFENLEFVMHHYGIKDQSKLKTSYSGLNHFFWITEIMAGKKNLLRKLEKEIQTKSFHDMGQDHSVDILGFSSGCELATDLFRTTGMMPYMADRHTCEFLSAYVTNRKLMRKYHLARTNVGWRQKRFVKGQQTLRELSKAKELPEHYHQPSRETAADIIAAHYCGKTFTDVGNLPNTAGQVPDLPRETVVETPVRVTSSGFKPIKQKPLPDVVVGLLEPCARSINMTVRACFEKDRELAMQALMLDPSCAHLGFDRVSEMGGRLLKTHRKWIDCF